jgi:hypothetical protein
LEKYIDDFSVLAIEQCLIGQLPSLFNAECILNLSTDEIATLAADSEETAVERARCQDKLTVLEIALQGLKALDRHASIKHGKSKVTC